jgi:hypothetical protein
VVAGPGVGGVEEEGETHSIALTQWGGITLGMRGARLERGKRCMIRERDMNKNEEGHEHE